MRALAAGVDPESSQGIFFAAFVRFCELRVSDPARAEQCLPWVRWAQEFDPAWSHADEWLEREPPRPPPSYTPAAGAWLVLH